LIPQGPSSAAHRALDTALFTPREIWPAHAATDLAPLLGRFHR
jgi:hypothetical protein